jgi:hypothetical protein
LEGLLVDRRSYGPINVDALEDPEGFGSVEIWNWLVLLVMGVPVEFDLDSSSVSARRTAEAVENSRVPSCLRC